MIPSIASPLVTHLLQSTLFGAAVWVLTLLLKKNRAPVRYGLWLTASCKFLVPFSLLVGLGSQFGWRPAPVVETSQLSSVVVQFSQPFTPAVPIPSRVTGNSTQNEPNRVPAIFVGVWLLGFAAVTGGWLKRWRHIRLALRAASPLPLGLPIEVLCASTRLEPGVFGVFRPVLLLPEGIVDRLTPAQMEAIIAHEMCHVRRRDNLAAAIHMVVEALFWFHPLVWWIEKRLVEERERACDEEVLRLTNEPDAYAEGILNVCRFCLESPLVCVSGVTGSNLKTRIEEIMTHRIALNLNFRKKMLLTAAGMVAVAAPIFVGVLSAPRVQAQPATEPKAFETVSVRLNKSGNNSPMGMNYSPGGRFTATNVPLIFIISTAYDLPFQSSRLSGAPDWVFRDRYDIEATAEKGAIPVGLSARAREMKSRPMLQTLLKDRFGMVMHSEIKEQPVYALVVGKNGPKLQKAKMDEKDCPEGIGSSVPCHRFMGGQGRGLHGKTVDMSDLVVFVSNWTDRPVVDQTGLKDVFDIESEGWVPMRPRPIRDPGTPPTAEDIAMADETRPTLFMIMDRLGLKLEPSKAPIETFVIERMERPSEN